MVQAATDIAKLKQSRPDWFTEAEQLLLDLIQQRNNAFKLCMKQPYEENQKKLKETRHNSSMKNAKPNDNGNTPTPIRVKKLTLEMVFKLMEAFQNHH